MQDLLGFLPEQGVRLGLAVVLGGVIGLEREASDKPAGLRTNILICLGSTLMMILSIEVARHFAVTAADPGRIAQGVITGIGFLGAGTILHSRGGVTGLTTAATTWAVSGIGLALGAGFYALAAVTTLLILLVLWVLGKVAHVKQPHWAVRVISDEAAGLEAARSLLEGEGVALAGWSYRRLRDGHSVVLQCTVTRGQMTGLLARLSAAPGIRSVKQL